MLVLSSTLYNIPITSLRLGANIGVAKTPIINPHNLTILGWSCSQSGAPGEHILLYSQIRQKTPEAIFVDDANALADQAELHRHIDVLRANFTLLGKLVKTPSKKLGKVVDYAVDDSASVQKIYVEKSMIKSLASDTLLISRTQIIEVTDHYITVADATSSEPQKSLAEKLGVAPQSA